MCGIAGLIHRDMIARELLIEFQMSDRHPMLDLRIGIGCGLSIPNFLSGTCNIAVHK